MVGVYTAGTPRKMGLRDHALMRYRLWQHRREWQKSDIPGFYKRARQGDVEGLAIRGNSWTVGDFLPEGFEAHVRLPNPFWKVVPPNTEGAIAFKAGGGEDFEDRWAKPLRHSEVAEANGLRMTHDASWAAICGAHDGHLAESPDQVWSWAPHECNVEPFVAEALFRILASESGPNGRCLCGQWEGGRGKQTLGYRRAARHSGLELRRLARPLAGCRRLAATAVLVRTGAPRSAHRLASRPQVVPGDAIQWPLKLSRRIARHD